MDKMNYKMPFDPGKLIEEDGTIEHCSVAESIAQNLMLLITTKKGENRYDKEYGNQVWDIEFDNAVTSVEWKNIFAESIKEQIQLCEKRIVHPKVQVHLEYVEHTYDTRKYSELKRKAKIAINAKMAETGEQYSFATELFLSPMSVD